MKVTRKISINKEERKVLNKFFEMCNEDLDLPLFEDMWSLLRAIFTSCKGFEVGDELYDIEYTDQGLYSP